MNIPYDKQTLDHPNPIARFAHRSRFRRALQVAKREIRNGAQKVVDFGCGEGRFLSMLQAEIAVGRKCVLLGYDPFMPKRYEGFAVVDSVEDLPNDLDLITSLEVCEHLNEAETASFLDLCELKLRPGGALLITVPIMLGPALFAKELVRISLFRRKSDTSLRGILLAGLLCLAPPRAEDIKQSHRGYDWRRTLRAVERSHSFRRESLSFSPLPLVRAYGNSQAILVFRKT